MIIQVRSKSLFQMIIHKIIYNLFIKLHTTRTTLPTRDSLASLIFFTLRNRDYLDWIILLRESWDEVLHDSVPRVSPVRLNGGHCFTLHSQLSQFPFLYLFDMDYNSHISHHHLLINYFYTCTKITSIIYGHIPDGLKKIS